MILETSEEATRRRDIPPVFLRVIFPSIRAGEIMKLAVNHIHQTYNISLEVFTLGRLVCTSGSPNKLAKAWYDCAIKLSEGYPDFYEQARFGINFVLPSHFIDLLLAKGVLERIAHRSRTKILVKHACLMRSTERVIQINAGVVVNGSLKCFEEAVYLLAITIEDKPRLVLRTEAFYQENESDNIIRYLSHCDSRNIVFDYSDENICKDTDMDLA